MAPLLVTSSPISTTMAAATTAAADAARDGQTALALHLAKHLAAPPPAAAAATNNHNHNVAFSPVSVHAALALTAAGARGPTRAQLLTFLGAPSAEGLADFGRRVADSVLADLSDAGGPRVLFGGGVWVDAACGGLTDAFRDVAAEAYKSEARTVSFNRVLSNGDEGDGKSRRTTFLSKVAHMAVVNVNEKGAKAGAVAFHVRGGSGPPPDLVEFTPDHPFTFFIMEDRVRRTRS